MKCKYSKYVWKYVNVKHVNISFMKWKNENTNQRVKLVEECCWSSWQNYVIYGISAALHFYNVCMNLQFVDVVYDWKSYLDILANSTDGKNYIWRLGWFFCFDLIGDISSS